MIDPIPISSLLAELIRRKGWHRPQADQQLDELLEKLAHEFPLQGVKVLKLSRGTLHLTLPSAPQISEVVAFHKQQILARMRTELSTTKIRDLKFQLRANP